MSKSVCSREAAVAGNALFDREVGIFIDAWRNARAGLPDEHQDNVLLPCGNDDALHDFFRCAENPLQHLLSHAAIAAHLSRPAENVFFDPESGDPLLASFEQRIYNLARRLSDESAHVPFRSIHPHKQTPAGDNALISSYPADSEIRYNSGNHFASRPSNTNVFEENRLRCIAGSAGSVSVLFRNGYLEDRLQDIRILTSAMHSTGETQMQFFVICSRHSIKEGHFGTALVIMDPAVPDFPKRVLICDTLQKKLPEHPRWWYHFLGTFSQVFGEGITELIGDVSHPLQKVNVKGDDPYRHDWDCPYYAASAAEAFTGMAIQDPNLLLSGQCTEIYEAMKAFMPDYYDGAQVKERHAIREVNRLKRWNSGRLVIKSLAGKAETQFPRASEQL
ncbi:MAG: hypothetical protein INR69_02915 [Mucilaginibacter polytrichastri]|nr:hypothetical protein [Mucilaginibacter polytrichastri]